MDEDAKHIGLRMPAYIVDWLNAKAKANGWTFSRALRDVLRREYEHDQIVRLEKAQPRPNPPE